MSKDSQPYTKSMTVTTIKVSTTTRDRLKAQARAANKSLGDYLVELADLAERQSRFESLRKAIDESDPAALRDHASESAEWERTELSDQIS